MPVMDIQAIRDILPHRYPMLLVDRIEELREIRREELMPSEHGSYGQALISSALMLLSMDAVLETAFLKKESQTA